MESRDTKALLVMGGVVALIVLSLLGLALKRPPEPAPTSPPEPTPSPQSEAAIGAWEAQAERTRLREEAERKRLAKEVDVLVTELVHDHDVDGGGPFLDVFGITSQPQLEDYAAAHPAVEAILDVASGSEMRRELVVQRAMQELRAFATDWPEQSTPDEPWKPTMADPGGLVIVPYILAELNAVQALPLLVRASDRYQEAGRRRMLARNPDAEFPADPHIHDRVGMVLAYGCDQLLVHCARDEHLQTQLSDQQHRLLESYLDYRDRALVEDVEAGVPEGGLVGPFWTQSKVISFARRFVAESGD